MGEFPLKSWLTGLITALSMPPIIMNTFSQYYYNGYILPELPNWDKNVYPYATILSFSMLEQFNFILLCTTKPFVTIDNKVALEEATTAIMATHNRSQWRYTQEVGEYEPGMWDMSVKNVIWSNYDLVDAEGIVYLAASEPIPRAPIPVVAATGVYDDTWPITWNTAKVANNKIKIALDEETTFVKISNLTFNEAQVEGLTCTTTIDGVLYEHALYQSVAGEKAVACVFINLNAGEAYLMYAISVNEAGYDAILDCTFPEDGLYASDYPDSNIDCEFSMATIDPVTIYSGEKYSIYNGYKLLTMPEYDESAYPYVLITQTQWGSHGVGTYMFASSTPRYKYPDMDCLTIVEEQNYARSSYTEDVALSNLTGESLNAWKEIDYGTANSIGDVYQELDEIIWTNYNICEAAESEGTVIPTDTIAINASPSPISLNNKMVVEWNGDTTDFVTDSSSIFYKVADITLVENNFIDGVYITHSREATEITSDMVVSSDGIVGVDGAILSVSTAGVVYNGMTFPEVGLYMVAGINVFAYSILWETLFEGEVTTGTGSSNGATKASAFAGKSLFTENQGIRITINGVSYISTAKNGSTKSPYVGNYWLYASSDSTEYEDNGLDWFVQASNINKIFNIVCTREPGTYQVKIERALFEPVAYLYNGVRLPKLPEWDKEAYPYAVIRNKYTKNQHQLFLVSSGAYYFINEETGRLWFGAKNINEVPALVYTYSSANGWGEPEEITNPQIKTTANSGSETVDVMFLAYWSNFDMEYDGVLYLASSNPIPVYE